VGHALAKGQQHRPHARQVCRLATNHDRQAAGLGADHPAGHWRIEPTHPGFIGQCCGHFPRCGGLQAGKIHQQLAAFRPLGNASRAKHHLTNHRGIGQAQHHHVGVLTQLGRCRHLPRTSLDQRCTLGRVAVPHRQRVTGRQQASAHRQTHQADSGEPQRRQRCHHLASP